MQFTLREMTARMMNPRLAAIWCAVTVVATMSGPFGTLAMPMISRAVYWFIAIGLGVSLSGGIIYAAYTLLPFRAPLLRGLVGVVGFSVLYAGVMPFAASFMFESDKFPGFWTMLCYTAPIAVTVLLIVTLFLKQEEKGGLSVEQGAAVPRLFKRLKPSLGADLIRLSMQDHYVEVVTGQGRQLVLMRLADALEEVEGIVGWQIHRSHWVAEAGIADIARRDGRTFIETRDGAELPVSRTYLPKLRKAGVLSRFT